MFFVVSSYLNVEKNLMNDVNQRAKLVKDHFDEKVISGNDELHKPFWQAQVTIYELQAELFKKIVELESSQKTQIERFKTTNQLTANALAEKTSQTTTITFLFRKPVCIVK